MVLIFYCSLCFLRIATSIVLKLHELQRQKLVLEVLSTRFSMKYKCAKFPRKSTELPQVQCPLLRLPECGMHPLSFRQRA